MSKIKIYNFTPKDEIYFTTPSPEYSLCIKKFILIYLKILSHKHFSASI